MALFARFGRALLTSSDFNAAERMVMQRVLISRGVRTGSHMSEQTPEAIENLKEKQLKGESEVHIPGTEGWSHCLASASEAVIKADKSPEASTEQLQKHSVDVIMKKHGQDPNPKAERPTQTR